MLLDDFSIVCVRGSEQVFYIGPNARVPGYAVARDIVVKALPGGPTIIAFNRGSVIANEPGVFIASSDVSCGINQIN